MVFLFGCSESAGNFDFGVAVDPSVDCGQSHVELQIDCVNDGTDLLTREDILSLGDGEAHAVELGGDGTCHIDQTEAGGRGAKISLEASCQELPVAPGGVGLRVAHESHITRVCNSDSRSFVDWSGHITLPSGRFRLSVDAASTLAAESSCRVRVNGADTDPLSAGGTNLWLSFETGPAELELELDCGLRDATGFSEIGCIGWTPGLPAPPLLTTFGLELSVVAEPVAPQTP